MGQTTGEFIVTYYGTNEYGQRSDGPMTTNELKWYANRARCDCTQNIAVEVRLNAASTDSSYYEVYAGRSCDEAQTGPYDPTKPRCVRLGSPFASTLRAPEGFRTTFSPLWLGTGVAPDSQQEVEFATPYRTCDTTIGQSDTGIWVCRRGSGTTCETDFVVTASQNINSGDMPQSFAADFGAPPTEVISDVHVVSGDGAVEVRWSQSTMGDINGFRVLCADAQGQPLSDIGYTLPQIDRIYRNDIYYTEGNLCPDGPFPRPMEGEDPPPTVVGEVSTGSDGGTGDSGSASEGTTSTGTDTGTGTGDATDSSGTDTGNSIADAPILSLDWDYVCTEHITSRGTSARITGLENGREYQLLLVAYDPSGNPVAIGDVMTGTPVETNDVWEQCWSDGDVCGDGGFCSIHEDEPQRGWAVFAMLGLLGVSARRRQRRAHEVAA